MTNQDKDKMFDIATKLVNMGNGAIHEKIIEIVSLLNQKKGDSINITEKFIKGYEKVHHYLESKHNPNPESEITTYFYSNYARFLDNYEIFKSDKPNAEDISLYLSFYRDTIFNSALQLDFSVDIFRKDGNKILTLSYDRQARNYCEIQKTTKKLMNIDKDR